MYDGEDGRKNWTDQGWKDKARPDFRRSLRNQTRTKLNASTSVFTKRGGKEVWKYVSRNPS